MKSVPIYYMGERLKDVYPHATRFQVVKYRVMKFVMRAVRCAGFGVLGTALLCTGFAVSELQHTGHYVAVPLAPVERTIPPILQKIAKAESGDRQFMANGLPVMGANKDKSVDLGKYQINNKAWGAKAHELGYDLLTEKGNEAMALWIFDNFGTQPWYSSEHSWGK